MFLDHLEEIGDPRLPEVRGYEMPEHSTEAISLVWIFAGWCHCEGDICNCPGGLYLRLKPVTVLCERCAGKGRLMTRHVRRPSRRFQNEYQACDKCSGYGRHTISHLTSEEAREQVKRRGLSHVWAWIEPQSGTELPRYRIGGLLIDGPSADRAKAPSLSRDNIGGWGLTWEEALADLDTYLADPSPARAR